MINNGVPVNNNRLDDIDLNSIYRLLGDGYKVDDYFEIFDMRQSYKQNNFSIPNIGFTNITNVTYSTTSTFPYNTPTFMGRLSIYNFQFTPSADINLSMSIPAAYADDTTRFRNIWGNGGAVVTAGVVTNAGWKYIILQSAVGNVYFVAPYGTTFTVSGTSAPLQTATIAQDTFVYAHNVSPTANTNICAFLNRWDGSHYLVKIMGPNSSTSANIFNSGVYFTSMYVGKDNVPLYGQGLTSTIGTVGSYAPLFMSAPFFSLNDGLASNNAILSPAFLHNDPRPAFAYMWGKRFRPVNNSQSSDFKNWFTVVNT